MMDGDEEDMYSQKFVYSVCMCLNYFVCGWILAQASSALLDLQEITSVTLNESSLYMSSLNVGFIVGSFVYGVVYNHVDKLIVQSLAPTLAAIALAAIPWCRIHVAMVIGHAIVGFCTGIIESVTVAEMFAVWGNGARSLIQAMHFSSSIGGIISPVVTAQFLSNGNAVDPIMPDHPTTTNQGGNVSSTPVTDVYSGFINNVSKPGAVLYNDTVHNSHIPASLYHTPRLYIAYTISACICVFVAIPFLIMFFTLNRDIYSDRAIMVMTSSIKMSTCRKIGILINMGLMAVVYIAIEESFSGFLPAFCITQLSLLKSYSSYMVSILYSCMGLGRLITVFWVSHINPKNVLGVLCLLIIMTLTGMLLCGLHHSDTGIWLPVAFIGLFFAVFEPTIMTWTEEDFLPVNGRIASYLNIAAASGSSINPVVVGTLMENYSPMWFIYILLIESCVLLMTYAFGVLLSRQNRANLNQDADQEIK